jgi:hypothetical protein
VPRYLRLLLWKMRGGQELASVLLRRAHVDEGPRVRCAKTWFLKARSSLRTDVLTDTFPSEKLGTSSVSIRDSSSQRFRPPSSSFTESKPRYLINQYAYAANQLLLPP